MPYKELTYKHLEGLKVKIQKAIKDKGIYNTGGASESLEVKENKLLGINYIYYLDNGRKPGKFPPVQNIRDWVRTKLKISDEKEVNKTAYAVSYMIKKNGTLIHQDKSKGIELDLLINDMIEELVKELPESVKVEVLKFVA